MSPALLPVKIAQCTQFFCQVWRHTVKSLSLTERVGRLLGYYEPINKISPHTPHTHTHTHTNTHAHTHHTHTHHTPHTHTLHTTHTHTHTPHTHTPHTTHTHHTHTHTNNKWLYLLHCWILHTDTLSSRLQTIHDFRKFRLSNLVFKQLKNKIIEIIEFF